MMPRSLFVAIAGGVAIVISACGGATGPSAPSPATPAAAPATASLTPAAKVVIASYEIQFEGFDPRYNVYDYLPQLFLIETSGQSAATITSVDFIVNGGDFLINGPHADTGCFLKQGSDQVPAGGMWTSDLVYYYCLGIETSSPVTADSARVLVKFKDADGRSGSVAGTATLTDFTY
jgi:hypothetical protein